jgi:hypothetical protein
MSDGGGGRGAWKILICEFASICIKFIHTIREPIRDLPWAFHPLDGNDRNTPGSQEICHQPAKIGPGMPHLIEKLAWKRKKNVKPLINN